MIWLPIAALAASTALVGGAKTLFWHGNKPNLGQALAAHAASREDAASADTEDRESRRNLQWGAAAVGLALLGRYGYPPLGLLATPLVVYLEWPIFQTAWQDLALRRFRTEGMFGLFVVGAWATGAYVACTVGIFVFLCSNTLTLRTRDRSRRQLIHMFDRQPRTVWLWVGGAELEVPFDALQAGDIVIVRAGQPVPADGVVAAGMATVDQHRLTGESRPAEKAERDAVFAATLVLGGWLHVCVENAGRDTLAMQIAEILRRTTSYHLAVEERGMQLAEKAVLPCLALSALAWPLLGFGSAVAVLSAMPGIDMCYAAPLALLNFLHLSAQRGILVKDGRSLELLHRIDTVVFDKTGTLTLERPEVAAVHVCGWLDENQVLAYAAAAECRQSHPIASAILAEAERRGLTVKDAGETRCEIGFGIQVNIDGCRVRVGSLRFMGHEGLTPPPTLEEAQAHCAALGHSLVYIAVDGAVAGSVELRPTLRPEAAKVVAELHQRGLKLLVLSGDRLEPTRHLAERLGIDEYFADVLPQDKAGHIERLQREGRSVCFVGDGINDAIALKSAHVSISLHGATTLAQDAAQIVMMEPSLEQLPALFDLARRLEHNLLTSFALSAVLGSAIVGGVFLFGAGIGHVVALSSVGVVAIIGNAMLPLLDTLKQDAAETSTDFPPSLPPPDEENPT